MSQRHLKCSVAKTDVPCSSGTPALLLVFPLSVSDSTNHLVTQGTDLWDILNVFLSFTPVSNPSSSLLDFISWVSYQSICFHPHSLPPFSRSFPCLLSRLWQWLLNFLPSGSFQRVLHAAQRAIFSKCKTYHAIPLAIVHGFPVL